MGPRLAACLLLAHLAVVLAQEPRLEVMPGSISKSLGDTVYVSCSAKVSDPDLITEMRWMTPEGDQIPGPETDRVETIGEGAGSLGLYIQKLQEQDTGVYNCSAVYAGNQNLHISIDIKSYAKIDFGDTLTHQTPVVGTDALIKCTVTSNPAPQVDWLKEGIPFRTDERHIIQQGGVLIKNIEESDEGVYRCRARVAELGALDSRDIQVEVLVPPQITTPPEETSGVEKEAVTFQCVAAGKPPPKYSWVDEQSRPVTGMEGYYVDEVKGELTILDLRPDQAGTYRCTATNAAGSDVAEAKLRVLTKPKLEQFLNITVDLDGNAEFRCVYSGDPLPEIIFQKETNPEPFVTGINEDTRVEVSDSIDEYGHRVGIMKISEVARTDDGLYTCTGRSTGGDTVGWGHITVQFPPTFEEQPTNEFWSWEQERVNLTCLATAIPNATVTWYLRNKLIPKEDANLRVLALGPVGVLEVNPLDNSYFGTYTCQAKNILGIAENDVSLRLVHSPGPLTSATVSKKTATTITWSLMEPVDNGGRPITLFLVQFVLQDMPWDDGQTLSWTKGSSYTVDNLVPETRYSFRFAARNEVGSSEWSGIKTEEMPNIAAPEEPLIFVRGEGVNHVPYTDHYDLQWKTPLDNGAPIEKFNVMYYQVVNLAEKWEVIGVKTDRNVEFPGPTTYTLKGLRPETFYRIELRASNSIGYSTPAEIIIKTANGTALENGSVAPYTEQSLGIGVVVAIAVIAVLVLAIVIDVICFFCRDAGLTAAMVHKVGSKDKDTEAMLQGGKNTSEKANTNGSPLDDDVTSAAEKDANPSETTPMIQGDTGDKAAILKEEEAAAAAAKDSNAAAVTKDSPV